VVVALVAAGAGFAIGRATAPDPSISEQIADAREEARPALSSLELVSIEYAQGVDASGQVAEPTELEAAGDHAAQAASALADAAGLEAVDLAGLEAARARVAELEEAIGAQADIDEIRRLVADAREAIAQLVGSAAEADDGAS